MKNANMVASCVISSRKLLICKAPAHNKDEDHKLTRCESRCPVDVKPRKSSDVLEEKNETLVYHILQLACNIISVLF